MFQTNLLLLKKYRVLAFDRESKGQQVDQRQLFIKLELTNLKKITSYEYTIFLIDSVHDKWKILIKNVKQGMKKGHLFVKIYIDHSKSKIFKIEKANLLTRF